MVLNDSIINCDRAHATLGNLLNPPTLDPDAPRVAHLYPTDLAVAYVLRLAGAQIVYAYLTDWGEPEAYDAVADTPPFAGTVRQSLRLAPHFNVLFVHNDPLPRVRGRQPVTPMEHALRFLRSRELATIAVLGPAPAAGEA